MDPYPLSFAGSQSGHPPGYLRTDYSINRYKTASAVVVHNAAPGEDSLLATMWCLLGEPVCGVALPLWVRAGDVPYEFCGTYSLPHRESVKVREAGCYTDPTSERYLNTRILDDGSGRGLSRFISRLESLIIPAAEASLRSWRRSAPQPSAVRNAQNQIASWAYRKYAAGSLAY